MSRKIINIDSEKCVGCGICARTCKQSAIQMINGKAVVTGESSCDGIGNCLPVCPVSAISFSDKDVINKNPHNAAPTGCPSSISKEITTPTPTDDIAHSSPLPSQLRQWPVQIKLVLENAGFFDGANLLIAADCSAFAYGNFHRDFMKNKVTLIGCPKLDDVDYTEKLTTIIRKNNIKSLTIVRMEVPCCGGIETAATNALKASGKFIPWQVVTISTDGQIVEN